MPETKRRKLYIRRAIIGTATLLVLGLAASWFVAGKLVAPQPEVIGDPPADFPAISISLESASGSQIAGWNISSDQSQGVVLLFHGIRGSRLAMLQRARMLHSAGYSIVMIDFQAHGESSGDRITIGYREQHDVRATVDFAKKQYPGQSIGVIGVSLGGASSLLASPLGIDALVLESVYPNIHDAVHNRVAAKLGPLATVPAEILLLQLKLRLGISPAELRPADNLATVGCPVFLISGREDPHTTAQETERMFANAIEPKELWLVDGAAHEDLHRFAAEKYESQVLRFLSQHLNESP